MIGGDGILKNPFGLRDGHIITVNDLNPAFERGIECACVCPYCKDPFEARMGDKRIWHFAHTGKGCDQVLAYLEGLYRLFKEFLENNEFTIPELNIFYNVIRTRKVEITTENYTQYLSLVPNYAYSKKKRLFGEKRIRFDGAEIEYSSNGRPKAVIGTFNNKRLAFVVAPPSTVCNDYDARPYKNVASLELSMDLFGEELGAANTEALHDMFSNPKNYIWLQSPMIIKCFDEINAEMAIAHSEYEERQRRIAEEERKQAEEARFLAEQRAEAIKIKKAKEAEERKKQVEEQARLAELKRIEWEAEKKKREEQFYRDNPKLARVRDFLLQAGQITADFRSIQGDGCTRVFKRTVQIGNVHYREDAGRFEIGELHDQVYLYMRQIDRNDRVRLKATSKLFLELDISKVGEEQFLEKLRRETDSWP